MLRSTSTDASLLFSLSLSRVPVRKWDLAHVSFLTKAHNPVFLSAFASYFGLCVVTIASIPPVRPFSSHPSSFPRRVMQKTDRFLYLVLAL